MIEGLFTTAVRIFTGANVVWQRRTPPDPNRPQIYFANHSSHLDFVLLWSILPPMYRRKTRPVAARDYWVKLPIRKYIAERIFRAVLIERSHITKSNNPLQQLGEVIETNESLILFPEGTRSPEGKIGTFKSGLYHLASHYPDVELVPVYLDNLNHVLPKGEVLPIPLICSITLGESLQLRESESKNEFLDRARNAIIELSPHT